MYVVRKQRSPFLSVLCRKEGKVYALNYIEEKGK